MRHQMHAPAEEHFVREFTELLFLPPIVPRKELKYAEPEAKSGACSREICKVEIAECKAGQKRTISDVCDSMKLSGRGNCTL